ncbi:uncharacterized protein LOC107610886 [Arachis ipaensis]|uniref:uncharacterized protein LOC107610886 n=1 Tax=Arachis ipaensis TaxID=130454 RepID=UPI000A2B1F68|nr:uncharacterized protein LOC107610886 [Arachis ipaensis]
MFGWNVSSAPSHNHSHPHVSFFHIVTRSQHTMLKTCVSAVEFSNALKTDQTSRFNRSKHDSNYKRRRFWQIWLPFTLGSEAPLFLSLFLPLFLSFTETQPKNPSTVSLHHRRKEWHTAAVRPSVYLAFLVLQVFNPCSLSPIAAASSNWASVVFVCLAALPPPFVCRSRSRLCSAVVFVRSLRRLSLLGVYCSRSLAVHRSCSHSRSFGSHVALLQNLCPTRALHLAVKLLSFVVAMKRRKQEDKVKRVQQQEECFKPVKVLSFFLQI